MSFGELLSTIGEWIWNLWPLAIVNDWESGVRVTLGRADGPVLTSSNGLFGTGLHWFLPVAGELIIDTTNAEVIETDVQTIVCNDGPAITFSLAVRYHITDLRRLYQRLHDHEDSISAAITGAAGTVCGELAAEDIEGLAGAVMEEVAATFADWGIAIDSVEAVDLVAANPIRLITGG